MTIFAETKKAKATTDATETIDYNPWFVPFDILITHPLGLATTITGTALFIVFSPFIKLSAIAPPHDVFTQASDIFIVSLPPIHFCAQWVDFSVQMIVHPEDIK